MVIIYVIFLKTEADPANCPEANSMLQKYLFKHLIILGSYEVGASE